MKRKPDALMAIIAIFFIGVAITGVSSAVSENRVQQSPIYLTEGQ